MKWLTYGLLAWLTLDVVIVALWVWFRRTVLAIDLSRLTDYETQQACELGTCSCLECLML